MSLVEVRPGQLTRLPLVPLRVSVTSSTRTAARLEVLGGPGTAQRITDSQVVVLPRPGTVQLSVAPTDATTFGLDELVGLSVRPEGGQAPQQVEVAQSALAGMPSARLAVLEIAPSGIELAATGPQRAPAWLAPGIAAVRGSGIGEHERADPGPWALVIDGSASMLARQAGGRLAADLRLIADVLYGWTNRMPELVLRTTAVDDADLTELIGEADPDLSRLSAAAPAAWSRLWPTLRAGFASAPLVVAMTDGVPVDVEDVIADVRQVKGRLLLITTGASELAVRRPAHDWQEELGPLVALDRLPNATVVALPAHGEVDERDAGLLAARLIARPRRVESGDGW